MTTKPNARVLLDSISPAGHRVITTEITLHRFVLVEFNTHRFSRNSASSRAIPVRKMMQQVIDDPAIPLYFPREQSGMQGGQELDNWHREEALKLWWRLRDEALAVANGMHRLGVHKSVVNRVLEPFQWQTIIATANYSEGASWLNFFNQRCSPLAQPEMRAAAEAIRDAIEASTPQELDYGQWHMPLIRDEDHEDVDRMINAHALNDRDLYYKKLKIFKRISAARCARVSYLTHDGKRDLDKDLELYDKLVSADPPHWSPLEHVCRPWNTAIYDRVQGNIPGWVQLRHLVPII